MARGQAGFEIMFVIFALFYLGFVTWGAANWPGATGTVTGSLSVPTLPAAPGILDYLAFAITTAWFYASAFIAFNINLPVVGLLSTTITLGMLYVVAKLIRG